VENKKRMSDQAALRAEKGSRSTESGETELKNIQGRSSAVPCPTSHVSKEKSTLEQ
jgi:hypothetical protein